MQPLEREPGNWKRAWPEFLARAVRLMTGTDFTTVLQLPADVILLERERVRQSERQPPWVALGTVGHAHTFASVCALKILLGSIIR